MHPVRSMAWEQSNPGFPTVPYWTSGFSKDIYNSGFSKWINHHSTSQDMFQDYLFLCNNVSNVVKMNIYVFGSTMISKILTTCQNNHDITKNNDGLFGQSCDFFMLEESLQPGNLLFDC